MKKVNILIVDDRIENLLTLEALLDDPDIVPIRATSGEDALARTFDHEFALVLLDVNMPGMDGYEVAELMRGNSLTRHIPIIFVTAALKEMSHIFRGYDSGAVDYLFKPLEPTIFRGKVGVFLELFRQKEALIEKTRELDKRLIELEQLRRQLEKTNDQLRQLSAIDSLTGLLNRRRFDEILVEEWQRGARDRKSLSLLIIDIDHFKAYNDTYGHLQGDEALKKVANVLARTIRRPVDKVARYGGEEFVVILPDTEREGSWQVAEKMRRAILTLAVEHSASPTDQLLTISVGIATVIPLLGKPAVNLVAQADSALYEAKEAGRNRCLHAQPGEA